MTGSISSTPIKVLLVEDDPEFAAMLKAILTTVDSGQFAPTFAPSLAEAVDLLKKSEFDIVVLDLFLPDSKGHKTFTKMIEQAPEIPIVVVTGHNDRSLAVKCVREGAQDYLVKGDLEINQFVRSLLFSIERHRSRRMLQTLSLSDELTGLLNRRGFLSLAAKHVKIAQRSGWELLLFFIDLDELKSINDSFGHPEGDQALRTVATILRNTFRTSDVMARIGGDEFIVLAINASDSCVDTIISRLHQNIGESNRNGKPYRVSLSYGVARCNPDEKISLEEMMARADQALYTNKRNKPDLSKRKDP